MNDKSLAALGGSCSILLGLTYLAIGAFYVFLPSGARVVGVGDPSHYYPALLQRPLPAMALYWLTAATGILGVAAVQGISELVRKANEAWVGFTSYLALFGFVVKAIDSFRGIALVRMRAQAWMSGDDSTRAAIGATRLTLDYYGWFAFGAVGFWVLVVCVLALRRQIFSKSLAYLGMALAFGYEVVLCGLMFANVPVLSAGVALGSILAPLWYIAMGVKLRRLAVKLSATPHETG